MHSLKADLHCHSGHSKGDKISVEGLNTPKEMVEHAKRLELDVFALTDHNEFSGVKEAEKAGKESGITIIPGEEISTASGRHIIGLGLTEKISPGKTVDETIDAIRTQGGISIAPHPFDLVNRGIREQARKCDAIEVFNAINLDKFSNKNAKKFVKKNRMPTVAGSDAHCVDMMGYGVTEIQSENNVGSLLKAIKKGKTKIHGSYVPMIVIQYWTLERFNESYWQVMQYIYENYNTPKRAVAEKLLALTKKSPGKIDYLFKGLTYTGLGAAMFYSAAKNARKLV